ncbi:MAG: DUF4142 domain-containing protein [Labilithrix sp.]|nr:DUF4142 domain-containing protein [Labilithrix sp.]MCW5816881.1 DUF4142 domain-containing protein [Labilithrix sp.]
MRNLLGYGFVALALSLSLGCANSNDPQPARDPIGGQLNQSQTPSTHPTPQEPAFSTSGSQTANDPIAGQLNQNQSPATNPTPQTAVNDPASQKPFYLGGEGSGGNKVLAKTETPMSDAEILGVILTVNDGEIQMAEQAAKKAKSADVKQFASMMKTHHGQGLTKTKTTETKTKITHKDSDLSSFLKGDVDKTIKDLKDKEGKDFDKGYIDAQVAAHKAVLTAIDNRLLPGAQNGDVKALVNETKKTVTDHVAKAEEVQKKVETTAWNEADRDDEKETKAKAKTEKGLEPRP